MCRIKVLNIVLGNKTLEEMFTREKLEINQLRICGCLVYVHIPKDKRSKLDISRKKGIFVGYSESLKAYRVYTPSYRKIETCRDDTFDEDTTYIQSKHNHLYEVYDEELEISRVTDTYVEEHALEDHDMVEPNKPIDSPRQVATYKRRLDWAREII